MKILNACLGNFYFENFGYQENLLPIYQKANGHDVYIAAPAQIVKDNKKEYIAENYENSNGIPVLILKRDTSKYGLLTRHYLNFYQVLEQVSPDVIFIHGGQSASIRDAGKYKSKHPNVKIYVDNHADYYNSPVTKLTSKLNSRFLIGRELRHSWHYVDRYFGVTPWRCEYLNDIYGLPKSKISLLHMGGEDTFILGKDKLNTQTEIKARHAIEQNNFLIVTGGKIDKTKNIHLLMQAVKALKNTKLIVFGNVSDTFKEEFESYLNDNVVYIGWLEAFKAYEYFLAADLVVFPGTHSVLWEQAVACKTPCLFKEWDGMKHVDIGGNCIFLKKDSKQEIESVLSDLISNKEKYAKIKHAAMSEKADAFLYSNIAKKSVEG